MDNKNIRSILQDALEDTIPSSQVELWSAVKTSLVAGKHPLIQQGENMNTNRLRRISRVTFAILTVVILLALAFITPQGRAFAQSILQFFIHSESDVIPVPTEEPVTWVDVTPGIPLATTTPLPPLAIFADECGDINSPTCSVEQIRNKVDFTIKELGKIPEGLYFVGATGGPDNIQLSYQSEDLSGGLYITMLPWAGAPSSQTDLIGASAVVEKVQIGNLTGEYFTGIFVSESGDNVAHWDPNFLGLETLRWVDDHVSYTIQYSYRPMTLGKEGMAALAESMTTDPVTKLPMPVATEDPYLWDPSETYNLSISEAEQQAGFKLMLPTRLPEALSLFGASYDSKYNFVELYYNFDWNQPNTNSTTFSQQVTSDPVDCFLCGFLVGDYNERTKDIGNPNFFKPIVPSEDNIETVQIGMATGKYIQGVWLGTETDEPVWNTTIPCKVLRWWANGMAFELITTDGDIEKADLIKIAESLK